MTSSGRAVSEGLSGGSDLKSGGHMLPVAPAGGQQLSGKCDILPGWRPHSQYGFFRRCQPHAYMYTHTRGTSIAQE